MVYSSSEFKYPTCRINRQNVGFDSKQSIDIIYGDNGGCKCSSCPLRSNYYHGSVYAFFSERRREHYDELNNNVFIWLRGLHLEYLENENPKYIVENIHVETGKNSMFYDDARRHMSRRMKSNIDNFERNLKQCNEYIDSINLLIDDRINEITSRPIHGQLTEDQISSIYSIVQVGFSQAIRSEEMETAIRKWDFATKIKAHGFTTEPEIGYAKNILAAIQKDETIMGKIKELKSKISSLEKQQDVIKNQSNEISSRIATHHYGAKRLCCPSLLKELWHAF